MEVKLEKTRNVMQRVYESGRLRLAWQRVKKNAGAAGIDRMSIKGFEERIKELAPIIISKLKAGE